MSELKPHGSQNSRYCSPAQAGESLFVLLAAKGGHLEAVSKRAALPGCGVFL
jgi:hypothetical protein